MDSPRPLSDPPRQELEEAGRLATLGPREAGCPWFVCLSPRSDIPRYGLSLRCPS